MSSTTTNLRIAIIGAGPVSLTLANILQNNDIPFTLFEASSQFRTQGGSLDLHPEAGQLALKQANLWTQFLQYARPESDVDKVVSIEGEVLWDENGKDKQKVKEEDKFSGRPEIDRHMLLKILTDDLKSDNVHLSKKLQEVVPSSTDRFKYDLLFADGSQETGFDVVVGGDGAWSKVRNLLSNTKPDYSGITSVGFFCNDIKKNPWLVEYIGEGSLKAFGQDHCVQAQRQGNGSLISYAFLRAPEDFLETCGIDWTNPNTARKEYIERYFSHIGEDLKRVVLECSDSLEQRRLYELPVGFTWPSRSGVTLIGDAAHVFTPFAGEGVNVGMKDALVLAQEIVKTWKGEKSLDEAIQAYEQEMYPRAAKAAAKTLRGKANHFSEGGSKEFADMLRAHYYQNQQGLGL